MEEREREKGGRKKLISTLEKATLSPPYSFPPTPHRFKVAFAAAGESGWAVGTEPKEKQLGSWFSPPLFGPLWGARETQKPN